MTIVNGLGTTNTWTVGFPETYILHDGAYLRGVVAYEQLLDAMEDAGLRAAAWGVRGNSLRLKADDACAVVDIES